MWILGGRQWILRLAYDERRMRRRGRLFQVLVLCLMLLKARIAYSGDEDAVSKVHSVC